MEVDEPRQVARSPTRDVGVVFTGEYLPTGESLWWDREDQTTVTLGPSITSTSDARAIHNAQATATYERLAARGEEDAAQEERHRVEEEARQRKDRNRRQRGRTQARRRRQEEEVRRQQRARVDAGHAHPDTLLAPVSASQSRLRRSTRHHTSVLCLDDRVTSRTSRPSVTENEAVDHSPVVIDIPSSSPTLETTLRSLSIDSLPSLAEILPTGRDQSEAWTTVGYNGRDGTSDSMSSTV